jgi:hypothetical protein
VAEQPEGIDAEAIGDREHVGSHPVERVRGRVVRLVARAVTAVVEGDRSVSRRQGVDVVGEVLFGPAEPVDEQQPRPAPGVGDPESHAIVHGHPHCRYPLSYGASVTPHQRQGRRRGACRLRRWP